MGGKTSTTTQQVQIPPEVLARYNAVNTRAETVAQKPFQIYSTDPADFVAQLNQQQQTGIENVNTAAGSYQPYLAGATGATMAGMSSANPADLEISKYMNPYQKDVINSTMARMRQEQEQAQSGALGTAISSGAFGGDRAGIAAANLAQQQGMATGATLAGLNSQNFMQALQTAQQQQGLGLGAEQANLARLLSGGQQLAGLGQAAQAMGLQGAEAQINAGTLGQQTEQAGLGALYNQFQQQQAYPFQVAQFLANVAMGTGALSGSTTQTTQPTSFWSDRRLKHDIKRIGKTDGGLPIYSFKYKGDDSEQTHVGFMADEVEKVNPDAVNTEPSGYKSVDYERATKAGGGGVAGPYGAMVGSQPGAGGYVPQAYLPVGELMIADSAGLENARMSAAQQLEAAANFGTNMVDLKDKFGKGGDFWEIFQKNRESENSRGGVVGYASGGPAYLEGGLKPAENPVQKEGYLSDTVKSQEDAKRNQIMQPGGMPDRPESGLKQVGDAAAAIASIFALSDRRMKQDIRRIGKTDDGMPIYKFKYKGDNREQTHIGFMADEVERKHPDAVMTGSDGMKRVDYGQADKFYQGGVVRPAYAVGGGPDAEEEIMRRRLLSGDVPKPMNLGDLPNARALPAVEAIPTPPRAAMPAGDLAGLAAAAIGRADVKPAVQPGLVPAAQPAADEVSEFYRTKILKQESGNRQFDENGNPLTSPAGAIGIGQVMPATGPEAAKMAGLPWDEERFRTDADYNSAIGEAYFRNMYDRFGSLDLAAAAYNAGPGRLSSAMDRAGAMGGSYLDYLPEETQNYVASVTGVGSASRGVAGGTGGTSTGEEYTGGLGLTPDKPYGERNALGKMFYNDDGKVNKNALLSILSGLGTMASSPSLYLGSSIIQGIGGAANTYAGLEKQAADIRGLDAQALQTTMQTAKDSIFPVDGVNMVMTENGLVPFWDFLGNSRLSTGERMVDDMIRRVGMSAQTSGFDLNSPDLSGTISVPTGGDAATPSIPSNVAWGDASQEALARDSEMMRSQPGQWFETVRQTSQILPVVNAGRSAAISGKPNVNEMAYVVGSAINEGNMGTAGEWYANNIIKPLETFLPADWASYLPGSPEQSALLEKLATLSASDMTPEQQRAASVFQQVSAVYPDLNMPPDAASAITASVMLSNQEDIDRANYYSAYLSQQPTGRGSLVNADAAFAQEYSQLHQLEKANLSDLFKMADDPTPVGQTGKTKGDFVKEFLSDVHSGRMSQEDAQMALSALLGAENTSPVLARYFIGGM
jgi:hypothetical protein